MNRTLRRTCSILAVGALAIVTAACSASGSVGTVPPPPATATPAASIEPDITPDPSAGPTTSPRADPSASPSPSAPVGTMVVRAYYVLNGDAGVEGLVPTLLDVPESVGVARAAMGVLLDGQAVREGNGDLSTGIPAGTRLLGLSIKDGIATVDLSGEFESGDGGAPAIRRLGQVVYTLTQFANVHAVLFEIEGRTVTSFSSEGIVLDGPQARDDFDDLLPSIFVDRPAWGAAIGNPARVTGRANVFEATLRVAILDGSGTTLIDQWTMATCGSGCRGTFDVTLRYDVGKAQWGTLRSYSNSAKDGQPVVIRDYPVWLTPVG
jgi:germination protein M